MVSSNPVFSVLTTSGNQAILAAGSRPDALNNGQLGIFNKQTGLSIDGSVLSDAQEIFIALGINRTTGGTDDAEDIRKSAGQFIQSRNMKAITVKGYVDEIQKVVEISNFTAKCDSDYLLNIEYRNQMSYGINGFNQLKKPYSYHTSCCPSTACDECDKVGSSAEVAGGLAAMINADPDGLVIATAYAWKITATINGAPTSDANTTVTVGSTTYTVPVLDADTTAQAAAKIVAAINTQTSSPYRASLSGSTISIYPTTTALANTDTFAVSGAGVTATTIVAATKTAIADTDTFASTYPTASAGLRITGKLQSRRSFNGSIPIAYYKNGTDFLVSLSDGLGLCNGTITTITDLQYPEGKGYDLQVLEYEALGWDKIGPYRTLSATGLQKEGYEYLTSATANYNIVTLEYDVWSKSGSAHEYENPLKTYIAIPCADSTTLTGLIAITDLIFANKLGALTDDVSAMDCTNAATSTLTYATDGIEIVT